MRHTFLPEGVIVCQQNVAWAPKSDKIIGFKLKIYFGTPPWDHFLDFF